MPELKPCWPSLTPSLQYIFIRLPGGSVPFFVNDLGVGGSVLVQLTGNNARLGDVINAKKKNLCVLIIQLFLRSDEKEIKLMTST